MHGGNAPIVSRQIQHLSDLLEGRAVDHIMLNELRVDDPIANALTGHRVIRPPASKHWITSLEAGSYDAVMQRHKSVHRRNFRRYDRRLAEHCGGALRLEVATAVPDVEEYLARAAAIGEQTYQAGLGASLRDDARSRRLLRGFAEQGWLRCYLLVAGDEPIAFHSGICHRNRWTAWGTGYRPAFRSFRPGTILITRIFRDLCEHGVEAVDWSFGDAEYKRVFGTRSRDERTIHIYGRGIRAGCTFGIDAASTALRRAMKRIDRSGSLTDRVKRLWRRRLERGR
jgi:CelD/BcsL family acetyltransferase involved in cellulose biosynthesis